MYFNRLRKEDEALSFDRLDQYSEDEINAMCFRRGIEIDSQNKKEKIQDLKLWLSISNQRNVPHSLLLYTRINDFMHDIFEVRPTDNEQSLLRRVSIDSKTISELLC